jgi:hypothetical protein
MKAAEAANITLGIQTSLRVEPVDVCNIPLFAAENPLVSRVDRWQTYT